MVNHASHIHLRPPSFAQMRAELRENVARLTTEVGRATPEGSPSDEVQLSLGLIDKISQQLTSDNVIAGKRFLRHCVWATRRALEKGPEQASPEPVREALESLRNSSLDISWVKEMRKPPSERWIVGIRPCPSHIPNFERVNEHVSRGGQPDRGGLQWLKGQGYKATLDLRGDDRDNQWIQPDWHGIHHHTLDIPDMAPPTFEQMEQAIEILDNPDNWPILVHCKAGVGRTGVTIACWRIAHGATAEEALSKEKINSYHGSLAQEQFVRDFEDYWRTRTPIPTQARPAEHPDGDPNKDPWLTVEAYNDLCLGRSVGEAIQARGLKDPKDIQLVMDFSEFLTA